jgi:hypothetical protein
MSNDEIATIRARLQAAQNEHDDTRATLAFVRHAPTDIAYLLSALARREAEAATLRQALTLAIEEIGTDMRYVSAETEQRIRAPLASEAGAGLAAALDAWCDYIRHLTGANACEQALYEAWRGERHADHN